MSRQNDGYILITTLLLLLVLTIVGLSAIGTSTMGNALSGNTRLRERNLTKAEAGADISARLINHSMTNHDTIGFNDIVKDATLPSELRSVVVFDPDEANIAPDVGFTVDTGTVSVDIDKMMVAYVPGWSIAQCLEYDATQGGGGGGLVSYHRVNATGSGLARSEAEVGAIYRYVPK